MQNAALSIKGSFAYCELSPSCLVFGQRRETMPLNFVVVVNKRCMVR
jgi:hypothetical protein